MGGTYIGYMAIIGVFTLLGMLVSGRLKSKFNKYNKMPLSNGMTGAQVAQKMLLDNGISDVKIVPGRGMLTDHYNPANKTISLSESVYASRSIGAAAVAAHETGHAVQHATAYSMLSMRSNLVPIVQFSTKAQQILFMFVVFGFSAGASGSLLLGILTLTFGITALFSLVTLPVEFDASKRALVWLDNAGITHGVEYDGAKDALWWAAMTYVTQALASLAMFLFFLLRFLANRR